MDQKDIAFVFLSLIVVYSVAFQIVLEASENQDAHHNTNNIPNSSNHNALLSPPINVVNNLLSNLPAITSPKNKNQSPPPASSPRIHTTATPNPHASPQIRTHNQAEIDSTIMSNNNDEDEIDQDTLYQMHLVEPHKPRLSTLSGNQHHIVEYHALTVKRDKQSESAVSNTILKNANLLITTVDGQFRVLDAENGAQQMSLDSSSQPLYQSPGTAYENQIIPGLDGQLYLLRKNMENEEYLEPLPFTIEQIAKNTGYADSFNTWYLVDPTNTVFWIDSDEWTVCKPAGNIPDITDNNRVHVPACNDALIVTRIDREITAVDVNSDTPSTQWRFNHGEYRVAARSKDNIYSSVPPVDLQRFQLWQSLDESSKYMLFLYDRHRGQVIWSKLLSSIVSNVKLFTTDNDIFNFYVYHTHTAKGLIEGHHDVGLWVVPWDKDTPIAIAHANRNPISHYTHMHTSLGDTQLLNTRYEDTDTDDEMDDNDDDDVIHIIEEDVYKSDGDRYGYNMEIGRKDRVRFVRLSFDGDLNKLTNIPSPAVTTPLWDSTLQQNKNDAQAYASSSALKIFNPKQSLLAMDSYYDHHTTTLDVDTDIEYYYGTNMWTLSVIVAALVLYLSPLRFPLRRLLFNHEINNRMDHDDEKIGDHQDVATDDAMMRIARQLPVPLPSPPVRKQESDVKVIGKLSYNVRMKLGAGRRGHVFCGTFEKNRAVAIKRIDKQISMSKVENEIDILLKVDHQSNIVRYYAKESDNEFDYIALDLCLCSLWDIIKSRPGEDKAFKGRRIPKIDGITKPIISHEIHINSLSISGQHPSFCCCNSCRTLAIKKAKQYRPSNNVYIQYKNVYNKHLMNHSKWTRNTNYKTQNMIHKKKDHKHLLRHKFVCDCVKKMMGEMMDGLIALHTAKDGCIIHRDIKPQNILIALDTDNDNDNDNENENSSYRCKLADMGMAKLMDPTHTSFDSENCGTLFWNAPELIYHKSVSDLKKIIHNKPLIAMQDEHKAIQQKQVFLTQDIHIDPPSLCSIFGDISITQRVECEEEHDEDEEFDDEYGYCDDDEESVSMCSTQSTGYSSTEGDETEDDMDEKMKWISSSLTKKVDIFSLGCVFSFLLSKGSHPYGNRLVDQHDNMEKQRPNLKYCKVMVPEVYDLISWMICIDPSRRPEATECKQHPLFWSDLQLITFINATSDYIEKCDKSNELKISMENASKDIIGRDWGLFVDGDLLNDAGKHRKYNFESLRDYLRLIRNKWAHFPELSLKVRRKLCHKDNVNVKSASKFVHYFTQYCPKLVMYCYKLIGSAIHSDKEQIKTFAQYFKEISSYRINVFYDEVRINNFKPWYNKH